MSERERSRSSVYPYREKNAKDDKYRSDIRDLSLSSTQTIPQMLDNLRGVMNGFYSTWFRYHPVQIIDFVFVLKLSDTLTESIIDWKQDTELANNGMTHKSKFNIDVLHALAQVIERNVTVLLVDQHLPDTSAGRKLELTDIEVTKKKLEGIILAILKGTHSHQRLVNQGQGPTGTFTQRTPGTQTPLVKGHTHFEQGYVNRQFPSGQLGQGQGQGQPGSNDSHRPTGSHTDHQGSPIGLGLAEDIRRLAEMIQNQVDALLQQFTRSFASVSQHAQHAQHAQQSAYAAKQAVDQEFTNKDSAPNAAAASLALAQAHQLSAIVKADQILGKILSTSNTGNVVDSALRAAAAAAAAAVGAYAGSNVRHGVLQKRPVIIGYGTGRGNGGGHKGEPAVPVKAMYRELKMAFRRHRQGGLQGGIVNVWEHLTTKKCHRCEQLTVTRQVPWTEEDIKKKEERTRKKYEQAVAAAQRARYKGDTEVKDPPLPTHDPPLDKRTKIDRDFRVCEHCSQDEQTRKIRNRDLNAAINILKLLECELRGEERPMYLCPDPTKRKRALQLVPTSCSQEESIKAKVAARRPHTLVEYAPIPHLYHLNHLVPFLHYKGVFHMHCKS